MPLRSTCPMCRSSMRFPVRWITGSRCSRVVDSPRRGCCCERPARLSEGQRYRFRMAMALATASRERKRPEESPPVAYAPGSHWIACDEFTATLERSLAKVVAFNLRKQVSRTGVGLLAATTHDDIAADLQPDLLVRCSDGHIEAERREHRRTAHLLRQRTAAGRRHAGRLGALPCGGTIAATTSPSPAAWSCCGMGVNRSASASSPRRSAALAVRTRHFGLRDPRSSVALYSAQ